jgi:uncharacterized protein (TIGR03089 family)
MTPYAALLARMGTDPASPMLTYRDLATGERMELSAASLGNAIAKTAGLLRDDLDVEPGDVVIVDLPLHWQRVVWLGACAATGAVFSPDARPSEADVYVTHREHLELGSGARDVVLVSLAPFGLPERGGVPTGVTDAAVAMRAHPDNFVPYDTPDPAWPLIRSAGQEWTHRDTMDRARSLLAARGVRGSERFAIVDPDPDVDVLALAGPLVTASAALLVAGGTGHSLHSVLVEEGIDVEAG